MPVCILSYGNYDDFFLKFLIAIIFFILFKSVWTSLGRQSPDKVDDSQVHHRDAQWSCCEQRNCTDAGGRR